MLRVLPLTALLAAAALAAVALLAAPAPRPAHAQAGPCTTATGALDEQELQMLALINTARAANSLPPLEANSVLDRAAAAHSENMATYGYLSHFDIYDRTPHQRVLDCGASANFGGAGENIGYGVSYLSGVDTMFQGWMDSPGHRAAILNLSYRYIGLGRAAVTIDGMSVVFWTTVFTPGYPGEVDNGPLPIETPSPTPGPMPSPPPSPSPGPGPATPPAPIMQARVTVPMVAR